jgi:hypothetical protein
VNHRSYKVETIFLDLNYVKVKISSGMILGFDLDLSLHLNLHLSLYERAEGIFYGYTECLFELQRLKKIQF